MHLSTFAAAAERKELYRFSVDLGKLALRIAERHGTNADRWYISLAWLSRIPNRILQSLVGHVLLHGLRI
jgi:hypothetical protein